MQTANVLFKLGVKNAVSGPVNKAALHVNKLNQAVVRTKKSLSQLGTAAPIVKQLTGTIQESYQGFSQLASNLFRLFKQMLGLGILATKVYHLFYASARALVRYTASIIDVGVKLIKTVLDPVIGFLKRIVKWVTLLGTAAVVEISRRSVNAFADFSQAVVNATTVTGAMGDEFDRVRGKLAEFGIELSRQSAKLPTEIAEGFYALGSAGQSVNEIILTMPGVLALAEGTMYDMLGTAELTTATLKAFKLSAGETNRVANAMAAVITKSRLNMERLTTALPYASTAANQLNLSLEQTLAFLAQLVDRGMRASMAGTQFRAVIARLAGPTEKAVEILNKYGLSVADINVEARGVIPVLRTLNSVQMTYGDTIGIFRRRAAAAAKIMIETVGSTQQLTKAITGTNAAFRLQQRMLDTLQGLWKIFKSDVQALGLQFTEQLEPALMDVLKTGRLVVAWVYRMGVMRELGRAVADLVRAWAKLFVWFFFFSTESKRIGGAIVDSLAAIWDVFGMADEGQGLFKRAVTGIADAMEWLADNVFSPVRLEQFRSFALTMYAVVVDWFYRLKSELSSTDWTGDLVALLPQLGKWLVGEADFPTGLADRLRESLVTATRIVLDELKRYVTDLLATLPAEVQEFVDTLVKTAQVLHATFSEVINWFAENKEEIVEFGRALRDISEAIFPKLWSLAKGFAKVITSDVGKGIAELIGYVYLYQQFLRPLLQGLGSFGKLALQVAKWIYIAGYEIRLLWASFIRLLPVIKNIARAFLSVGGALSRTLPWLAAIWGAVQTVGRALAAAAAAIVSTNALIVAAILALVAAFLVGIYLLSYHWEEVKEFFAGLWEPIAASLERAGQAIAAFAAAVWSKIKSAASGVLDLVVNAFAAVGTAVMTGISNALQYLDQLAHRVASAFVAVGAAIVEFVSGIPQYLGHLAGLLASYLVARFWQAAFLVAAVFTVWLPAALRRAGQLAVAALDYTLEAVPRLFSRMTVAIFDAVQAIPGILQSVWDAVVAGARDVYVAVTNHFARVGEDIVAGVRAVFVAVMNFFARVTMIIVRATIAVAKWWDRLPYVILNALARAYNAVKQWAHDIVEATAAAVHAMVAWFRTLLPRIVQVLQDVVDWFWELPGKLWDAGKAAAKSWWEGFKEMFSWGKKEHFDKPLAEVRDSLPASDAKKGPLSDITESGRQLAQTFFQGAKQGFQQQGLASMLPTMPQAAPNGATNAPSIYTSTTVVLGEETLDTVVERVVTRVGVEKLRAARRGR